MMCCLKSNLIEKVLKCLSNVHKDCEIIIFMRILYAKTDFSFRFLLIFIFLLFYHNNINYLQPFASQYVMGSENDKKLFWESLEILVLGQHIHF